MVPKGREPGLPGGVVSGGPKVCSGIGRDSDDLPEVSGAGSGRWADKPGNQAVARVSVDSEGLKVLYC